MHIQNKHVCYQIMIWYLILPDTINMTVKYTSTNSASRQPTTLKSNKHHYGIRHAFKSVDQVLLTILDQKKKT